MTFLFVEIIVDDDDRGPIGTLQIINTTIKAINIKTTITSIQIIATKHSHQ